MIPSTSLLAYHSHPLFIISSHLAFFYISFFSNSDRVSDSSWLNNIKIILEWRIVECSLHQRLLFLLFLFLLFLDILLQSPCKHSFVLGCRFWILNLRGLLPHGFLFFFFLHTGGCFFLITNFLRKSSKESRWFLLRLLLFIERDHNIRINACGLCDRNRWLFNNTIDCFLIGILRYKWFSLWCWRNNDSFLLNNCSGLLMCLVGRFIESCLQFSFGTW